MSPRKKRIGINCNINHIVYSDYKCFLLNSPIMAKLKVILLTEYVDYAQVFSKEATDYIPSSCPHNHKIDLNDSFMPKIGKIYLLSPDENKATKDIPEDSSFQLLPSIPLLLHQKKDGKMHLCQEYHYLNEHTTYDAYPLPFISNLINKLKDTHVFTKFDVH